MLKQIAFNVNPVSSYNHKTQHVVSQAELKPTGPLLQAFAKQITLKKSQFGIFSVMAYFIKFGFKEGCFIKQTNYAAQLKKFGYRPLRRQQVAILCGQLVEKGLVTRTRRHRRAPYEYQLTELGQAYYLIKNPQYQKQPEPRRDDWPDEKKPYIENNKNRTSQSKILFNKTSYKNSWGQDMKNSSAQTIGLQVKTQERLDRDKINEQKAESMAIEALEREGMQNPYKNAPRGTQVDYVTARDYNAKLSSYTCYFRNSLSAN